MHGNERRHEYACIYSFSQQRQQQQRGNSGTTEKLQEGISYSRCRILWNIFTDEQKQNPKTILNSEREKKTKLDRRRIETTNTNFFPFRLENHVKCVCLSAWAFVCLLAHLSVDEANLKLQAHRVTITYSVRLAIWILNLTRSLRFSHSFCLSRIGMSKKKKKMRTHWIYKRCSKKYKSRY